ncbi:polysaccharide deacetylase family protein [Glaciibacter superstes]|uniref:polysaccharide deacetylase family protein n=1 Tax=Glaciibacter superstes TaxID=501023 RepID=UPI0003B32F2E|nr:polysaccharide deacetylase family protein [Glaciibacter superstes]
MDRRAFLTVAGSALLLSGCAANTADLVPTRSASAGPTPLPALTPVARPVPIDTPTPVAVELPPPAPERRPVPGGTLTELPGEGNLMAWTVDDGASTDVVARYTQFAADSGTRLTFFLNGSYDSWAVNAPLLLPLVQSGQVQLGNHTWSHADLTELSDTGVVDELQRNHDFIEDTYGVDARPFFRPPFGYHDDRVDDLAAGIGYTVPTLWYGSLSDSGLITEAQVVEFATKWFLPQHIVIGRANFEPVCNVFPQLLALVAERGLQTVNLNDVFTSEAHP